MNETIFAKAMEEDFNSLFGNSPKELINRYESMLARGDQYFFDVEEFQNLIDYYISERKNAQAFEVLDIAKKQHPSTSDLLIREAELLAQNERFTEALSAINSVEDYEPYNLEVYLTKASILSQNGKIKEAISTLKRALTIADESELDEVYMDIAFEYQNLGQYDPALKYLKRALFRNPENDEAIYEISYCYEELDKMTEGIEFYSNFIDQNPYSSHAWFNQGNMYVQLGLYEKALESFDFCTIVNEEFASGHFNKGLALRKLEEYEKAIDAFQSALKYDLIESVNLYYIGLCYEDIEYYREAEIFYRKCVKSDERMSDAWLGLANVLSEQDQWIEALHHARHATIIDENNPKPYHRLAQLQGKMNYFEEAFDSFEIAIDKGMKGIDVWIDYCDTLYDAGEENNLSVVVNRALDNYPHKSEIYYRFAAYLTRLGQLDEAENILFLALSMDKSKINYLFEFTPEAEDYDFVNNMLEEFENK